MKRAWVEGEDLVPGESCSLPHELLELFEAEGDGELVELGMLREVAEELGIARVVSHKPRDRPLVDRELLPAAEVEGDGSMVAELLLVA